MRDIRAGAQPPGLPKAPNFQPNSFHIFLLKIARAAAIWRVPYCYVYELQDQGWRSQPRFMAASTHKVALDRILDHVVTHSLKIVSTIFHGGEPLLVGPRNLDENMAAGTQISDTQRRGA